MPRIVGSIATVLLLGLTLTLTLMLALAGCATGPDHLDTGLRGPVAAEVPPELPANALTLRAGKDFKASLSLTQVLERLPRLPYLPGSIPGTLPGATQPNDVENAMPLAAQRAYAVARASYLAGDYSTAVRELNNALLAAPENPGVLKLLGIMHLTVLDSKARGGVYLEQALKQAPDDIETLFILGRSELEQGRYPAGIALLARALAEPEMPTDAGMIPLMRHLLAGALEREGYDLAAAQQYEASLRTTGNLSRTSRFVRELFLLARQRGRTWEIAGDAYNRAGQHKSALEAYQESAVLLEAADAAPRLSRMVYTLLRLGEAEAACRMVLTQVRAMPNAPASISMVRYLLRQGVRPKALTPELGNIYAQAGKPEALAVLLADMLPTDEAIKLLRAHLATAPEAWPVFAALLERVIGIPPRPAGKVVFEYVARKQSGDIFQPSPAELAQALRETAGAMERHPALARQYAAGLQRVWPDIQGLIQAFAQLSSAQASAPMMRCLHALALREQGQTQSAQHELRELMNMPGLAEGARNLAKMELARLLVEGNQGAAALPLLESLPATTDAEVVALRAKALVQTGDIAQALALLDTQLAGAQRGQTELILLKAGLLRTTGRAEDAAAAEQLLWDAIEARPLVDVFYQALFAIYDTQRTAESEQQRANLLRRAVQTIPTARITRVKLAEAQLRGNNPAEAQRIAQGLLAENPQDLTALELMLVALHREDRTDDAVQLLEQRLRDPLVDRGLLVLAQNYFRAVGRDEAWARVTEQLLLREPVGEARSRLLARLYLQTRRPEQAVTELSPWMSRKLEQPAETTATLARAYVQTGQAEKVDALMAQTVEKYPPATADIRFEWAMLCDQRGQKDKARELLQQVLAEKPTHARAGNALGYAWVEQGRNLAQARRLIDMALRAEPRNPAYLDSLGWWFYQTGDMAAAVEWLTKARLQPGGDHPVILTHLGDALWRADRRTEALQYWGAAQRAITPEMLAQEPETRTLQQELSQRLDAITHDREPVLPGIAVPLPPRATQPASVPTTNP